MISHLQYENQHIFERLVLLTWTLVALISNPPKETIAVIAKCQTGVMCTNKMVSFALWNKSAKC